MTFSNEIIKRLNDEFPKGQEGQKIYCKKIKEIKETSEGMVIKYFNQYLLIVDILAFFIYKHVELRGEKNGAITKWVKFYIKHYIEVKPNSLATKARRYRDGKNLTPQAKFVKELCEECPVDTLHNLIDTYFKKGRWS